MMLSARRRWTLVALLVVLLAVAAASVDAAKPRRASTRRGGALAPAGGGRTASRSSGPDPDTNLDTMQLIRARGFAVEAHQATTADGYVLTLHRIPAPGKPVVMLQHGLLDTSATFVINGRQESLGYILSSNGFDVWLANSRGNRYSQGHTSLSTSSSAYWAFDFDQHAMQDIPASVARALSIAGKQQLVLISHSQGATASFVALAQVPALKRQVSLFIALAPVTFLAKQKSKVLGAMGTARVDKVLKLIGDREIIPLPAQLSQLLGKTCALAPAVCAFSASTLFGPSTHIPRARDGVLAAHWPDRTSVRNMRYWIQNARTGGYADFSGRVDYGSQISKYYSTPTAILSGRKDLLANPQDVQTLLRVVGNTGHLVTSRNIAGYSHMDFTWAPDAASLVYPDVLKLVQRYATTK